MSNCSLLTARPEILNPSIADMLYGRLCQTAMCCMLQHSIVGTVNSTMPIPIPDRCFCVYVQAMQMQQTSKQDSLSGQLNPAPVSGSSGQTAVTQVVAASSRKHPPLGQLTQTPAQQIYRFRHDVELQQHPKVGTCLRPLHTRRKIMAFALLQNCYPAWCYYLSAWY